MMLRTIIKYGLPTSFLYCTIYQQNIWREGDEQLVQEQKRVWRDFFGLIDSVGQQTWQKLNILPKAQNETTEEHGILARYDSLNVRNCYNTKVQNAFVTIDQVVSKPKVLACKVYRKIQPYVAPTKPETKTEIPKVER